MDGRMNRVTVLRCLSFRFASEFFNCGSSLIIDGLLIHCFFNQEKNGFLINLLIEKLQPSGWRCSDAKVFQIATVFELTDKHGRVYF